jgi:transposase
MGYHFIASDAGQAFLLPQDVREWLPEDHVCWKMLDAVAGMDLSVFLAGYRRDGQGHAAYHPAVMVALVLYCYRKGIRSSRGIEAACWDDVGARIITANHRVDHATLARFIRQHREALDGLFVQVLALCVVQGLVDPGMVAIDGSVMDANASRDSNRSLEQLEAVIAGCEAAIAALLEETAACAQERETDPDYQVPDERAGRSGPARLARLSDRLTRARSARGKLYARALPAPSEIAEKTAAAERMAERAERALSEAVTRQQDRFDAHAQRTATDRAAGLRGTRGRPPLAVECKAVVVRQRARLTRTLIFLELARHPRPAPSYFARASLTDPDSRLLPGKHGGYLQGYNLQISCACNQLLIAVELHDNPSDRNALVPMVTRSQDNCSAAGVTGQVGAWLADNGYASTTNFEALAHLPLLVAVTGGGRRESAGPDTDRPPPAGWAQMAARHGTPDGKALYKRRAALVEPGFAQLFQRFGRRLNYRGDDAVDTEIKLLGTVHNLSKLFAHNTKTTRPTIA